MHNIVQQTIPFYTMLPCPALPYPTLPYPTLPYPTLPYPTLLYPTLPYPTLPYPTLPYSTLPYSTLPYPTLPYPTLFYTTLHYTTPPCPPALDCSALHCTIIVLACSQVDLVTLLQLLKQPFILYYTFKEREKNPIICQVVVKVS